MLNKYMHVSTIQAISPSPILEVISLPNVDTGTGAMVRFANCSGNPKVSNGFD